MRYSRALGLPVVLTVFAVGLALAQRTAREVDSNSVGTPNRAIEPAFKRDVFTFARIKYASHSGRGYWGRSRRWAIDFPDSDLNFSYRLQQMTSLKVDPNGRVIEITDKELF